MKKITIKDIAKASGVSNTTISRVLSNNGYVSKETRQKVLEIINKKKYIPNILARSLRTNKTNTFGLIIPDFINPFFGALAKGITDAALKRGYNVILCNSDYNFSQEILSINTLIERQIDALIIATPIVELPEIINLTKKHGIKLISLEKNSQIKDLNFIDVDHFYGGRLVGEYLTELGHKNFFFLGNTKIPDVEERLNGFQELLKTKGIDFNPSIFLSSINDIDEINETIEKLAKNLKGITAIFAANDFIASIAIAKLLRLGLKIPDDISVIGYDDISFSSITIVPLTTVRVPTVSFGNLVTEKIIDILDKKEKNQKIRLVIREGIELIERNSCKSLSIN